MKTHHDDSITKTYLNAHKLAGTDPMAYTASIKSGRAAPGVHKSLDPKGKNKAGKIIRESRDSDLFPESNAVAVGFDQTGSMGTAPRVFQQALAKMMAMLTRKGYLKDPHILFAGIGDASMDGHLRNLEVAPCQVGQFEAGNEMDSALSNIYIEGDGGGQKRESYELFCYFMAKHASMDCLEKRGVKGRLFIIGDECPYPMVKPEEVKRILGETLQAPILFSNRDPRTGEVNEAKIQGATGDLLEELQEKFDVFWIMPGEPASYWDDSYVNDTLKAIFGQRFIKMQDINALCETICSIIGMEEGYGKDEITDALRNVGSTEDLIVSASTALEKYEPSKAIGKRATVTGEVNLSGTDEVKRVEPPVATA